MKHVYSAVQQIEHWLTSRRTGIYHRRLIWISGDLEWANQTAEDILRRVGDSNTLWVGQRLSQANSISLQQTSNILGSECDHAVYNAFEQFGLNEISRITGTIKRNGLLLLLCPAIKDWPIKCQSLSSQSYGYQPTQSLFISYLINHLSNDKNVIPLFQHSEADVDAPVCSLNHLLKLTSAKNSEPTLTSEQTAASQIILQKLSEGNDYAATITARRGRGKSWLLGWIINTLIAKQGFKIALVAPNAKSSNQIFQHLGETQRNERLTFVAPDNKRLEQSNFDLVIIDEAAAIPLPMLKKLIRYQRRCIFSSTLGGYEGSANGFRHRFIDYLNVQFKDCFDQFTLNLPMRWNQGDYLENTIDSILTSTGVTANNFAQHTWNSDNLTFTEVSPSELLSQPQETLAIFELLSAAHYQTTPNDFVRMLDAQDGKIFILKLDNQLVGAALCIEEGNQPLADIATDVSSGKRRVRGHLTPQYLSYYTTNIAFCNLRYLRINRLAIEPTWQTSGLGSELLSHLKMYADERRFDMLSTVFGSKQRLTTFWKKNRFQQFKIGDKVDKASGEVSALYLLPLNKYTDALVLSNQPLTAEQHRKKLSDFSRGYRNLASVRLSLNALYRDTISSNKSQSDDTLLIYVANNPEITEQQIVARFGMKGKKHLTEILRTSIRRVDGT